MSAPARAYPRYAVQPEKTARDRALAALARMPTTIGGGRPASVRAMTVFGIRPTGIAIPLNRKTTQQAITTIPLEHLEPRQEFVPLQGLESYIARPRRDPPDVARVKMRDGTERLLVQEGHTRLGAAILRGDEELPVRLWEFVQTATGDFEPVVRGRERIGQRHRDKLRALSQTFSLPDISDVSFPSVIGAIPSKPKRTPPPPRKKRRRKPVTFKGVKLGRTPMQFEVHLLSLAEIPPRLDAAVLDLLNPDTPLAVTLSDLAHFGMMEVLKELVRQGAPDTILTTPPDCDAAVLALAAEVQAARTADLDGAWYTATLKVDQRRLPAARKAVLVRELADRWTPGILKRHAARAVNMAFALGRATVINHYRRPHVPLHLASKQDMLVSGALWVDAVIQTAVMDTSTCEECEDVDGEVMELGDDRQEELHPPYVKCLGGDRCRCLQVALLSDGSEIDVDEVPDEAYEDDEDEDF